MKKIYINMKVLVAILLISNQMFVSGQTQVTRYTPKGSPVRAYNNIPEMSSTDKADWSTNVLIYYPNATQINPPSATRSYNCHAYAWHVKEGGDAVWIGYYEEQKADEDIYWTDGSYVEQASEAYAEKISYYTGNHSAVQSDIHGVYISKWGPGPLMRHQHDDGPSIYNMSYRKYYKKALANPTISGPSQVCDQATYTVDAAGATVVWSASPSGIVSLLPSGSSVTLTKVGSGKVTLSATINNSFTVTKDIWVGGPIVEYIDGPTTVQPGMYNLYYAQPQNTDNSSTTYYWHVYPSNTTYTSTGNVIELAFPSGQSTLVVSSENTCGYGMGEPELDITATGSGYLTLSPNPSADLVQVSLDATSISSTLSTNTYSVKVVDDYGTIVSSGIKKEKKFNIPTSTFRNGIYTVIVSDGSNTYQNKLIVNH